MPSHPLIPQLYAERADHFTPSPIRAVFDISMDNGMISLAGGNPDLSVLPLEQLSQMAATIIREQGMEVLQYGTGAGVPELRREICQLMQGTGIQVDEEQILITSGSQMGLELFTSMFCDPGDIVLAESPTYVGAIGIFQGLEAEVHHVLCDDDGLIPQELERTIQTLQQAGRTIKFLYTIPNFNNPSGMTLSVARRPIIAEICARYSIAIVEDDPYGMICFDDRELPAIRSFDSNVFYLGSLSKIFSPGLRIGWLVAPAEIRARLQIAAESTTICASVLSQHLALNYLRRPDWRATLTRAIDRYRQRATAAVRALEMHAPVGVSWTQPIGGFFIWLTLPSGISADALFTVALDEGVVTIPGTAFHADGSGDQHVRLSYSLESPAQIEEGIIRLSRAIERLRLA
ncbi:MAG: PLP-dependent aminotransferase family protein [Rhodoglobus sp.]